MLSERNVRDSDMILKQIKENKLDFGKVCIIAIGDFFKLPPVVPPVVFELQKGASMYYCLAGNTWQNFKVHKLKEIVRQSSDPEFTELLDGLREEKKTRQIIEQIRALEDADTTNWTD